MVWISWSASPEFICGGFPGPPRSVHNVHADSFCFQKLNFLLLHPFSIVESYMCSLTRLLIFSTTNCQCPQEAKLPLTMLHSYDFTVGKINWVSSSHSSNSVSSVWRTSSLKLCGASGCPFVNSRCTINFFASSSFAVPLKPFFTHCFLIMGSRI